MSGARGSALWRDRRLAPVWALAVSLAVAAGAGAVLDDPTTIRVVTADPAGPATFLGGNPIAVYPAPGGEPLAVEIPDGTATFTILNPKQRFQVCILLPAEPPLDAALRSMDGRGWCWFREPAREVVITLVRPA